MKSIVQNSKRAISPEFSNAYKKVMDEEVQTSDKHPYSGLTKEQFQDALKYFGITKIKDLAEVLGVSDKTASAYWNEPGKCPAKRQERLSKACYDRYKERLLSPEMAANDANGLKFYEKGIATLRILECDPASNALYQAAQKELDLRLLVDGFAELSTTYQQIILGLMATFLRLDGGSDTTIENIEGSLNADEFVIQRLANQVAVKPKPLTEVKADEILREYIK